MLAALTDAGMIGPLTQSEAHAIYGSEGSHRRHVQCTVQARKETAHARPVTGHFAQYAYELSVKQQESARHAREVHAGVFWTEACCSMTAASCAASIFLAISSLCSSCWCASACGDSTVLLLLPLASAPATLCACRRDPNCVLSRRPSRSTSWLVGVGWERDARSVSFR